MKNISYAQHVSPVPKSSFLNTRDLRRIRSTIDHTNTSTIATSVIHSRVDYCNSNLLNLPATQITVFNLFSILLPRILEFTLIPKCHNITPIIRSLQWLTIYQNIQYKVLTLTQESLNTGHPAHPSSLLSLTPHHSTRSSSLITLNNPSVTTGLNIFYISSFHSAMALWICLPSHLRQSAHHSTSSLHISDSCISRLSTCLSKKKWNFKSFASLLHHNMYSPGFSQTDISGSDPAWDFHLIFISAHLQLIHSCNFLYVFNAQVFKNKSSLSCSTFISTTNQLHYILLFIVTSSHTILVYSSHLHLSGAKS